MFLLSLELFLISLVFTFFHFRFHLRVFLPYESLLFLSYSFVVIVFLCFVCSLVLQGLSVICLPCIVFSFIYFISKSLYVIYSIPIGFPHCFLHEVTLLTSSASSFFIESTWYITSGIPFAVSFYFYFPPFILEF